jgi:D-glycero-alpha-D-manno-heptose-7-phosphate kinase
MPASTGMGGSSAFAVGLLNALHTLRGERVTAGQLAEEACYIEMQVLNEPIGKQDQYAAAYGGMNLFRFHADGSVSVEPQHTANGAVSLLFSNIMMFWTGHQRPASAILSEQKANSSRNVEMLRKIRDDVFELRMLCSNPVIDARQLGRILNQGWELKRKLASSISNNHINGIYDRAIAAGAEGGKLCGAGGGGFLMFVVMPEYRQSVRDALSEFTCVPLGYEVHGSCVLHSSSH